VYTAIRKSKIPVLVVPEGVRFAVFRHIILATDLEQIDNDSCLLPLFEILRKFDAELHVLHVRRDSAEVAFDVPGHIQLGHMLSKFSYGYDEIKDASVEHGIREFVKSHPADLLIMIAHRHNIFSWLLGKVYTKTVSRKTVLPLLILEDKHI
jgi:nucleotide-binding universal stress UspA family protein